MEGWKFPDRTPDLLDGDVLVQRGGDDRDAEGVRRQVRWEPGWRETTFEHAPDKSWGGCHSAPGNLPADLERANIEITTRRGDSRSATVLEVIERREDFVLVLISGNG